MTKTISMEEVSMLVIKMVSNKVSQVFPSEDEKFYNENIKEMIVDEEGTVFILPTDSDEPIMIPAFVSVA